MEQIRRPFEQPISNRVNSRRSVLPQLRPNSLVPVFCFAFFPVPTIIFLIQVDSSYPTSRNWVIVKYMLKFEVCGSIILCAGGR